MRLTYRRKQEITGYLFIAPTYLFYIIFMLLPVAATIYFSFTKYNVIKPAEWIGLDNYLGVLKDKNIREIFENTLLYTALSTLFKTVLSLALAIGLNSRRIRPAVRSVSRAAVFFPYIVAMSYVSMIWMYMFSKDMGIVNYFLNRIGLPSVPWFTDARLSLYMLVVLDVWKNAGYGMLIFLAGLQNISREYYEAAQLDGAGFWQSFRYITLPLLRPMLVMVVILNTISGLQAFDSMSVVTNGGPGNATRTIVLYLYGKAFESYNMGYASALSVILIIAILLVTLVQMKFDKNPGDI